MPRHDFRCDRCGQILVDIYVPVAVGATAGAPLHCGTKTSWIAAAPAVHYGSVKTCAFKAFDTTDGYGQPVHIDSLQKLRKIEKDSEQAFRNGEGQPLVFRAWANTKGNKLDSALHKTWDGGEHPTPEAKHRFGSTLQKGATDPGFGPGVSEANASALPMASGE